MTDNKKICLITMARNDNFFLEKWMEYYGRQLAYEDIYIYLDGLDSDVPHDASGKVHIIPVPKIPGQLSKAEPGRLAFLSERAAAHLKDYDIVIGCDADEYLVVEPGLGMTLKQYLSNIKIKDSVSGIGLDVVQNEMEEEPYDPSKPILEQRSYAILNPDYTKPCVMVRPLHWGVGFHRIRGHNYHIDPNLYMFHFGCFDAGMLAGKFNSSDLRKSGWEKHLRLRRKSIDTVTNCTKVFDGDKVLPCARFIQKWFRPIYKWNRPSMLNMNLVVRVPERFRGLI